MSKVDAQRAMREAKYARLRASGPTRREEAAARGTSTEADAAGSTPEPARPARKAAAPPAAAAKPDGSTASSTDALCGHQSISGRTCTREAGHPQKSHRYG